MKAFMIKWVLSTVIDLLITGLKDLSKNTDNDIDDKVVDIIMTNKDQIINEIKKRI